jgi:5-methylcytosine-specific restriction endonuclease McrA
MSDRVRTSARLSAAVERRARAMPLELFPEERRAVIDYLCSQPRPPKRYLVGSMCAIESRAYYEWFWRRGRYPDVEREKLPPRLRAAVIARDGLVCGICRTPVDAHDVHIDHVIPWSQGGRTELGNLRVTHSSCNLQKSDSFGETTI